MKTPHKHAEVIKAWADGHTVQYMASDGRWYDLQGDQGGNWHVGPWRIKPETRKGWYRVALMKGALALVADETGERLFQADQAFIRWLTPRTEYEVD